MELYYPPFASSEQIKKAAKDAPPLKKGSTGVGVKMLQIALVGIGYNLNFSKTSGEPNGIYDDEVHKAVSKFQADHLMPATGIADAKTIIKLDILASSLVPTAPKNKQSKQQKLNSSKPLFKLGSGRPPVFPDKGAGIHNSKPKELHVWGLKQLILETLPPRGSAAMIATGPDATRHLQHYFEGNGPLNIRFEKMIKDVPVTLKDFKISILDAQRFCETLPNGTHNIVSTATLAAYAEKSVSKNWYYAIGGYSTWGAGAVEISENGDFVLDYNYHLIDRYNWDGGKSVRIAGVEITDDFMGEFHRQGFAKEFDTYGKVTRRITWKKGETLPVDIIANNATSGR